MPGFRRFAALLVAAVTCVLPAAAKPPIEAFGDVPEIRAMDISPDGTRLAYINRVDGKDHLVLFDLATRTAKPMALITEIRARGVQFVSNTFLVLTASQTTKFLGFRGRHEYSAAFAFDISTGKIVQMLTRTEKIYPAQTGLGDFVGVDPSGKFIYMPAYMGAVDSTPSFDLLKVSLETGHGDSNPGYRGVPSTRDWIVDANGKVAAREDFSAKTGVREIRSFRGGAAKVIYSSSTDATPMNLIGISGDGASLIAVSENEAEADSLYRVSMTDGKREGPLFARADAEIEDVIIDDNRVVYGVAYSGMQPSYDMFDRKLQADVEKVLDQYPQSSVKITGWSQDWSKVLFYVSGGAAPERFVLLDRATQKVQVISRGRNAIKQEDIGEVVTIEYKARDGLKIPALITWPVGVAPDQRKNLPLVVMPHGGPELYDSIGFNFLSQFLANEGYVVLQPNYRGSAGFGQAFRTAGHGQWGRKMQDDITDGVNALVTMGWANKERVCIVGWSYGGYAALAGGALTPDLYKCVASVAGPSDLRDMIIDEQRNYGSDSPAVRYWKHLIGDPVRDREAIDAVSPSKLAANFKAPVLLIHGTDDTVVPSRQSDMMNDALKAAGKNVDYVRINGDDHSLMDNDSRKTALTKVSEFLAKYLGKAG